MLLKVAAGASSALSGAGLGEPWVFEFLLSQTKRSSQATSLAALSWGDFKKVCLNVCHLLVSTGKSRKKLLLNTDHTGFYLQARDRFHLNLRKFRLDQTFPYYRN